MPSHARQASACLSCLPPAFCLQLNCSHMMVIAPFPIPQPVHSLCPFYPIPILLGPHPSSHMLSGSGELQTSCLFPLLPTGRYHFSFLMAGGCKQYMVHGRHWSFFFVFPRHRGYQNGSHSPLTVVPSQALCAHGRPKSPRKLLADYASEALALPSAVHIPMPSPS